ncbi:VapE domain-containing protein [Rufibacter sp. XAAS-G3-1]|uniref:VapE domain-containing protein n=1 Tax=Rufibacter sp. XAAS-G3-1 TaxID=2729134 RepID=UPI0015E6F284|nr:VapE domain-containing protein [Rufibacter sp. XAAS-G3-1]
MNNNDKNRNELRSNFRHFASKDTVNEIAHVTSEIENRAKEEFTLDFQDTEEVWGSNQNQLPQSEIDAVKTYIRSSYDTIRTNKLTNKIELVLGDQMKELNDRTVHGWLNHLWSYSTYMSVDGRNGKETIKKVTIDKNKLFVLIENDAFAPIYDPITEYFKKVAPLAEGITETNEIDKFIRCFTCDNDTEVVEKYFKYWLEGVFINYYSLTKVREGILILQSAQGTGKTTAIEQYLLNPFRSYVVKSFDWNMSNKDEMIKLATSLFIFDDELSATKKSEVAELKKITSLKQINNVRPAYGRTSENYTRKASFIGATNNMNIINDDSGSRRFLILGVTAIDLEAIKEINYDLLWSEAYNYFHKQSNTVYVDFDTINENNQIFRYVTADEEYLQRHFDFTKQGNVYMNTTMVLDYLKEREPNLHTNTNMLGKALIALGAVIKSDRWNGPKTKPSRRYHLHKKEHRDLFVQPTGDIMRNSNDAELSWEEMFPIEKDASA